MIKRKAVFDYEAVYTDFFKSPYCLDSSFSACLINKFDSKQFFWSYMPLTFAPEISHARPNTILKMFNECSDSEIFNWIFSHRNELYSFIADRKSLVNRLDMVLNDFPNYENSYSDFVIHDFITIVMQRLASDFHSFCKSEGFLENNFKAYVRYNRV